MEHIQFHYVGIFWPIMAGTVFIKNWIHTCISMVSRSIGTESDYSGPLKTLLAL